MKELILTKGQVTSLDDDVFEWASENKWCASWSPTARKYYAMRAISKGKVNGVKKFIRISLHRLIMGAKKGQIVDHIDGNPLNNRRDNLRFATRSENNSNKGPQQNNTSGFKGVSPTSYGGSNPWAATIKADRKQRWLGQYATAEQAARAYDKAARELHGEFAHLNFPDEFDVQAVAA